MKKAGLRENELVHLMAMLLGPPKADGACEGLLEGELETGLPFGALVGVSEDG